MMIFEIDVYIFHLRSQKAARVNNSKKRFSRMLKDLYFNCYKYTLSNFSEYFLPAEYLQGYLKIADNITSESVAKIVSAISEELISDEPLELENVLYMYGTAMNEYLSRKSVKALIKKGLKNSLRFDGQGHCYKAIYEPMEWCRIVEAFLT